MSRNKQKMEIPFNDPAAREFASYLLRQINKVKEDRKRDRHNIARHEDIITLKVKVRPFEEDPEVAD